MRNLILQTLSPLVLLIYPLSLSAQNSFSLSLDMDGSAGDQAVTSFNVSADQIVAIQIFGKDIQNANDLTVRFEYDASQATYEGFDTGDVLPNAQTLPEQGTNPTFVEIGIASLGGQAMANSGLVGTIRFRTTAAFSGTVIRLVRAELGRRGQIESVTVEVRVALQVSTAPSPDFNGDGVVGFPDFLLFVGVYGSSRGDGTYQVRYDLDGDGVIGVPDFLIFVDNFGKEVSGGETVVSIPDANLRAVIADNLGKERDAPITTAEMATLNDLRAVQKNIRDLTGLEYATNLTLLDISDNKIEDVSSLSGLTNLTELFLGGNSITDLSPLSGLTNLTKLYLYGNSISDLSPLSGLTNLTALRLGINSIMDVSSLSGLTNLTYLSLYANSIMDVSSLSGLTNLTKLHLWGNSITDLSPLSGLTNLTNLGLSDNNITDFSPVSDLTNLRGLGLSHNKIGDVSFLSGLTNLTTLWLGGNSISDLSSLSGLTNLTYLSLLENKIEDVSSLSGLTNLTRLLLWGNSISDLSPLSGLTNLRVLDISINKIEDVSFLSGLTNLRDLGLTHNKIEDVSFLSGLTNLTKLYLFRNSITDLLPLVANTGLGRGDKVDVRNNPLSDQSRNVYIPALRSRGVTVQFGALKPAINKEVRRMPRAVLKALEVVGREWEVGDLLEGQ